MSVSALFFTPRIGSLFRGLGASMDIALLAIIASLLCSCRGGEVPLCAELASAQKKGRAPSDGQLRACFMKQQQTFEEIRTALASAAPSITISVEGEAQCHREDGKRVCQTTLNGSEKEYRLLREKLKHLGALEAGRGSAGSVEIRFFAQGISVSGRIKSIGWAQEAPPIATVADTDKAITPGYRQLYAPLSDGWYIYQSVN